MKNRSKFMYFKFHTLNKSEWDELTNLINKICNNHKNDAWWKVDTCIRTCVDNALIMREAEEDFSEFCEEGKHED